MTNEVVHFQLFEGRARAVVVINTDITREAVRRHSLDPIATIALGRAIACAAALASTLKHSEEYVHVSFAGNGPLGKVIAECNGEGSCRGYTEIGQIGTVLKEGEAIPQTVSQAMGRVGLLTVTKGRVGESEPYRSVIDWADGEIATDVARYLSESDQIPSAVAAGVNISSKGEVLASGAVLVQQLGGSKLDEQELSELETRMANLNISDRISRGESVEKIFAFVSDGDKGAAILNRKPLEFQCSCSREKMANALHALGKEELELILKDVGKIESCCPYCSVQEQFSLEELTSH